MVGPFFLEIAMTIRENRPFWIPTFIVPVSDWKDKKQKLLSMVDFDDADCIKENQFTDYHKYVHDYAPYKQEFVSLLLDELMEFANYLDAEINIGSVWCQRYANENLMEPHNHGSIGYSAVLYAELDEEHQATTFTAPYLNFNTGSVIQHTPKMSEGEIIFFPSAIMHYAKPNKSKKNRTIFSFNVKLASE